MFIDILSQSAIESQYLVSVDMPYKIFLIGDKAMDNTIFQDDNTIPVSKDLATVIGLNEAIVLQQVHYWLKKNSENEANMEKPVHFRDDRWWTYNTLEEWQEKNFPFWNVRTVQRNFRKLEKEGLLIVGNYNRHAYDHTKWYSIDYDRLESLVNTEYDNLSLSKVTSCRDRIRQCNVYDTIEYPSENSLSIDYQLNESCKPPSFSEDRGDSKAPLDMDIVKRQIRMLCKDKDYEKYTDTITNIFVYFYKTYRKALGKDHTRLTQANMLKAIERLVSDVDAFTGWDEMEDFRRLIDDYFKPTHEYKNCNHSILHFTDEKIINNCYMRTLYRE